MPELSELLSLALVNAVLAEIELTGGARGTASVVVSAACFCGRAAEGACSLALITSHVCRTVTVHNTPAKEKVR